MTIVILQMTALKQCYVLSLAPLVHPFELDSVMWLDVFLLDLQSVMSKRTQ